MLRIITQPSEVETELGRIKERFQDPEIRLHLETVREVLETVKRQGNQAVLSYARELDKQSLTESNLKVSGSELDAAYQQISKELLDGIRHTVEKMTAFHRLKLPKSWVHFQEPAIALGKRYHPLDRAGIYLFDGSKAYLSLLLRHTVPAKVAQVKQIVLAAPAAQNGKIHPALLVAAQESGVEDIYRVGGPQAIAALAYGTETIPPVDAIVGPGDVFVTAAKKQVSDRVRVDGIVPNSELVILADSDANPDLVALDLLAQAEQHPLAAAILLTPSLALAEAVKAKICQRLQPPPQHIFTEKAIAHYGLAVVVDSWDRAAQLSNFLSPTHVQILLPEPWELLEKIRRAGTILLGTSTPKLIGDYLGSITVDTFLHQSHLVEYSSPALKQTSNSLEILVTEEEYLGSLEALRWRNLQSDQSLS